MWMKPIMPKVPYGATNGTDRWPIRLFSRSLVLTAWCVASCSTLNIRNVTAVPIGTVSQGDHPAASTAYISSAKSASVPAYSERVGQATGGTRSPGSGSPETGSGCAAAGERGAVDMGLQIVVGHAMLDK